VIRPLLADDALLAAVAAADPGTGVVLWWLGQSGFLVKHSGGCLLLDPYLSDSLTKKYAQTDKPHVRLTARAVDPARLDCVNLVTSSHHHTDHLDAETISPLRRANPRMRLVIPEAHRSLAAERLGCPADWPEGMTDGQERQLCGVEMKAVLAAHESIERDPQGHPLYLGYVVRCGAVTLYHSGDTVPYEGQVEALRPLGIDLALLPINGRRPERRVAGNLWGREAAWLARQIGARLVIPCHYDMFAFNTEPPDEFLGACRELGQPCRVLQCGEPLRWPATTSPGGEACPTSNPTTT
jgi:L-ascorbate metabolism protein UlaG (beta-lactamase superfamily)